MEVATCLPAVKDDEQRTAWGTCEKRGARRSGTRLEPSFVFLSFLFFFFFYLSLSLLLFACLASPSDGRFLLDPRLLYGSCTTIQYNLYEPTRMQGCRD